MAFRAGDRVRQQDYGPGDLTDVSGRYISVTFDEDGVTRTFVTSMVRLQPTVMPRPAAGRTTPRTRRTRIVAARS